MQSSSGLICEVCCICLKTFLEWKHYQSTKKFCVLKDFAPIKSHMNMYASIPTQCLSERLVV